MQDEMSAVSTHATMMAQRIVSGSVSAANDTKVAATIGASTIFAGITASDLAIYVGIVLSTLLVIKTSFDIHFMILRSRKDAVKSILEAEILRARERDRQRALEDADKTGYKRKRISDL